MKLNKILSSALVLVMIFTALVAVMPVQADAAYDSGSESISYTSDEIKVIVEEAIKYNFASAEEMLAYELSKGYLDSVTSSDKHKSYTIYVNRYTGALYYVNNLTGQILTSNPYDVGYITASSVREELSSQVVIDFTIIASGQKISYNSTHWAANYGQISTDYIKNGIRVNYTLGDTTARFLLPGRILADKFEEKYIIPALNTFEGKLVELLGEHYKTADFKFIDDKDAYNTNKVPTPDGEEREYKTVNSSALNKYFEKMFNLYEEARGKGKITPQEYNEIDDMRAAIKGVLAYYTLKNPAKEYSYRLAEAGRPQYSTFTDMIKEYYTAKDGKNLEIYETYAPMYEFDVTAGVTVKRKQSLAFQKYSDGYTFTDMYEDEALCGYVDNSEQKPVFRCSLEYSFNSDGSLSAKLPASSITYDESVYILEGISPLKFFGAGDMLNDGYIFYPDGSGTVVDFEDFRDTGKALYLTSEIFGSDYCYTTITGQHREQITMPVYGIYNKLPANGKTAALTGKDTVNNGYFAIIEEGAPLTKIGFLSGGVSHKYACVFNSYTPNPSDVFDITGTVGVGEATEYKIVSESKYSGTYVTRYVMLTDEVVGEKVYGKDKFYPATYAGMAAYYRKYLEDDGTLKALEALNENKLPLYIEALGSMEINDRFLTFPIRTKIPLTTFENVAEMYRELGDTKAVKKSYEDLAKEYEALANNEPDAAKKAEYLATAEGYRKTAEMIVDITNVNFRLMGFGNGGMYYTYPTKVRWDNACGDRYGLEQLLVEAEKAAKTKGSNLGVYPDYDFMYLKYDEWFDGIGVSGNVSRMIDNRYASKQMYNQVLREWESAFDLVINPASLENLYASFISQYDDYGIPSVSVSTLGSDLNSNFDEDEPTNRVEAMGYVSGVLGSMKNDAKLDIMTDVGNIYSVKYVSHILNASIDSSHFIYSSYSVPFFGMVLHGYVNYTGTPINYVGTPEYDILRSIENGASLYYILCYQNSAHMKDDEELNQYYGVDYNTWYSDIVTTYAKLNAAIGNLQEYHIVDHKVIIGERIINENEVELNFAKLKEEIKDMLKAQLDKAIDEGYKSLESSEAAFGTPLTLKIDYEALMTQFAGILNKKTVSELDSDGFSAEIKTIVDGYLAEFGTTEDTALVNFSGIDYSGTKYSFITDSLATDEDYVYTDYTSDVGNIVLVTYSNGKDTVKFILNYNIYSVSVNLGGGEEHELGKYEFVKIEG